MRWLAIATLVCLAGCTVGPNYCPPEVVCTDPWEEVESDGVVADATEIDLRWWESFNDPLLNWLIDEAVKNNNDVAEAAWRVLEARARRAIACSDYAPQFTPSFRYQRTHESGNQTFGGIITPATILNFNEYELQLESAWEVDFWGRIRREVQAANADLSASIFDRRAVILTLLGEVATTYLELRGFQKQLKVAHDNIDIQTVGVEVTTARFDAGITSMLDVTQQRSLLAQTEASVPVIKTEKEEAISRLGVLLGRCPADLVAMLSQVQEIPPSPPEIHLGVPCDLILRRPDVRQAERELAAATAQIGVAMADYFPRISLFQLLGLATQDYQSFFETGSILWDAGLRLLGPIIQGARLRANVDIQRAVMQQRFYGYKQSVLVAFEEVRNAIIAYGNEKQRFVHLAEALENSRGSLDLSSELYTNGLTTFLDVLVAQRSVNDLELELAQSEAQISIDAVILYKALGGGWETTECW